jgi:hypothetical protein
MPKRDASLLFFPRQKEGKDVEPGPLTRHIRVNQEVIKGLFHLKLKDAAREIGLCPTTFKKACRRFHIKKWPSRQRQRDAVIGMRHQEPGCVPAAHTLQTTEVHQDKRAVTASCTSHNWHDEFITWKNTSDFSVALSPTATSSSTVRASPELHGYRKTVAPLDAPSNIDSSIYSPCFGEQGGSAPHQAGPLQERSCVEAVMDYLALGGSISEEDVESILSSDD